MLTRFNNFIHQVDSAWKPLFVCIVAAFSAIIGLFGDVAKGAFLLGTGLIVILFIDRKELLKFSAFGITAEYEKKIHQIDVEIDKLRAIALLQVNNLVYELNNKADDKLERYREISSAFEQVGIGAETFQLFQPFWLPMLKQWYYIDACVQHKEIYGEALQRWEAKQNGWYKDSDGFPHLPQPAEQIWLQIRAHSVYGPDFSKIATGDFSSAEEEAIKEFTSINSIAPGFFEEREIIQMRKLFTSFMAAAAPAIQSKDVDTIFTNSNKPRSIPAW